MLFLKFWIIVPNTKNSKIQVERKWLSRVYKDYNGTLNPKTFRFHVKLIAFLC